MNFAENILFTQRKGTKGCLSTVGKEDYKVAVTEVREGSTEIRQITWGELRKGVGKLAQAMKAAGIKRGDRIAGMRVAFIRPLCLAS
jgi:acetoacetyl-CoA synthetase